MPLTDIAGFQIDVRVKPIRSVRLSVLHDGSVRLSVPRKMPWAEAEKFVREHLTWLRKNVEKRLSAPGTELSSPAAFRFEEGGEFIFLGKKCRLHLAPSTDGPACVSLVGETLTLQSPSPLLPKQRQAAVEAWYARQFRSLIQSLLTHWLAAMHEAPLAEVRFRPMTSRWGSCFPVRRVLCFNTRLVFYPQEAIESVVVHELCHLKEASHNARFHALMRHYLPDYQQRSLALKKAWPR